MEPVKLQDDCEKDCEEEKKYGVPLELEVVPVRKEDVVSELQVVQNREIVLFWLNGVARVVRHKENHWETSQTKEQKDQESRHVLQDVDKFGRETPDAVDVLEKEEVFDKGKENGHHVNFNWDLVECQSRDQIENGEHPVNDIKPVPRR